MLLILKPSITFTYHITARAEWVQVAQSIHMNIIQTVAENSATFILVLLKQHFFLFSALVPFWLRTGMTHISDPILAAVANAFLFHNHSFKNHNHCTVLPPKINRKVVTYIFRTAFSLPLCLFKHTCARGMIMHFAIWFHAIFVHQGREMIKERCLWHPNAVLSSSMLKWFYDPNICYHQHHFCSKRFWACRDLQFSHRWRTWMAVPARESFKHECWRQSENGDGIT